MKADPANTRQQDRPDALEGVLLARQATHHAVAYQSNGFKPGETFAPILIWVPPLRRKLAGLRSRPFLPRPYVHNVHLASGVSVTRNSETNRDERHAESQCSRAESHFDRGDGQNDCG